MTRYFEINAFVETLSSPECNEYIATLSIRFGHHTTKISG